MKEENAKQDTALFNMDIEKKDLKVESQRKDAKIFQLEEKLKSNDSYLTNTFKYMTNTDKKASKTAYQMHQKIQKVLH